MTSTPAMHPARVWLEHGCRALAIGALALAAWRAVRDARASVTDAFAPATQRGRLSDSTRADARAGPALAPVRAALVAQAQRATPDTVVFTLSAIPPAPLRGALSVMAPAGVPVRWVDSTGSRGLALSIAPAAGARAGYVVRASGGDRSLPLVLRDAGGVLDSVPMAGRSAPTIAAWRIASLTPPVSARAGITTATVALPESTSAKRVLVLAQPGWESKFTVAALEELGWRVDASLRIAPTGAVLVGAPQRLDTARYAAVIVLDSMAVDAPALSRFVRQGGGLVLAGDALRISTLAALRPARASGVRGALAGALLTESPRRGLEAWELEVEPEATVLQADAGERSGDHAHAEPAVVVRRVATGRVAATAYRDLWRWRMQGTDDGAADHRAWWGMVLAAVVPDGVSSATRPAEPGPGDAAPFADLVGKLGEPSAPASMDGAIVNTPRAPWRPSPGLLFVVAASALLVEWASRRLRGAR